MFAPPTRAEGLARLARFVPRAGSAYAANRNEDRGPRDRANVSTLSPWVRHRLVSEREVLASVLAEHGLEEAEKFVQEVLWRTYWKGWLEQRPAIWERYLERLAADLRALDSDLSLRRRVEEATAGRTGIAGFDDWARELVETGYLHNHARMWFSSIWIFTLRLPWTLGADFFLRHLLDGDPASNTLSWRWTAGLQTPGKTYLARADNIARFTNGRFAPGGLSRSAEPLSEPPPPAPAGVPPADRPRAVEAALLVTEEDMTPEHWEIGPVRPRAVLVGHATAARSILPPSGPVRAFAEGAVADAAARAADHYGVPAHAVSLAPQALTDAARALRVGALVTAWAPVGPAARALARAEASLADAGVALLRLRRPLDERAWPHATRGFFAFRKAIPDLLAAEGLIPPGAPARAAR
ncbi:FAD-binding domain-containing protein [Salinarimonas chemoclinalis]|uniref:FAD-binding domain-containing protein n=1 Tax=Salinarimonas chemoclinalis TaxID=3241599 RepID=UPI0035580656